MRKFILFTCILIPALGNSQMHYRGADGILYNIEFHDAAGRPIPINDHSDINGTPLLQDKWTFGVIILNNGGRFSDSSLNYSLFDDKLFLRRGDEMYPFNYPAKEFLLENAEDPDGKKIYHFQKGFPEVAGINRNDSLTFYEVLSGGRTIELIKWEHKKLKETYPYSGPTKIEYSLTAEYFVFFPKKNKIVELGTKVNLNVLKKKLPGYSDQIDSYNSAHPVNWKKEDDLIQFFSFLEKANFSDHLNKIFTFYAGEPIARSILPRLSIGEREAYFVVKN